LDRLPQGRLAEHRRQIEGLTADPATLKTGRRAFGLRHTMAELDERVVRLEATLERIFDRLDQITNDVRSLRADVARIDGRLENMAGRLDNLPGRWMLLAIMLPLALGLFLGLASAAFALYWLAVP
jgi:chromosome segregation ATPase